MHPSTILMHAGVYKYHPEYYTGDRTINATTPVYRPLFVRTQPTIPAISAPIASEAVAAGLGALSTCNASARAINWKS